MILGVKEVLEHVVDNPYVLERYRLLAAEILKDKEKKWALKELINDTKNSQGLYKSYGNNKGS